MISQDQKTKLNRVCSRADGKLREGDEAVAVLSRRDQVAVRQRLCCGVFQTVILNSELNASKP